MAMDIAKLVAPAVDWTGQTWAQRIDDAASLLFLHGYIPQSQRAKIAEKINGQFAKAIADGSIVERPAIADRNPEGGDEGSVHEGAGRKASPNHSPFTDDICPTSRDQGKRE